MDSTDTDSITRYHQDNGRVVRAMNSPSSSSTYSGASLSQRNQQLQRVRPRVSTQHGRSHTPPPPASSSSHRTPNTTGHRKRLSLTPKSFQSLSSSPQAQPPPPSISSSSSPRLVAPQHRRVPSGNRSVPVSPKPKDTSALLQKLENLDARSKSALTQVDMDEKNTKRLDRSVESRRKAPLSSSRGTSPTAAQSKNKNTDLERKVNQKLDDLARLSQTVEEIRETEQSLREELRNMRLQTADTIRETKQLALECQELESVRSSIRPDSDSGAMGAHAVEYEDVYAQLQLATKAVEKLLLEKQDMLKKQKKLESEIMVYNSKYGDGKGKNGDALYYKVEELALCNAELSEEIKRLKSECSTHVRQLQESKHREDKLEYTVENLKVKAEKQEEEKAVPRNTKSNTASPMLRSQSSRRLKEMQDEWEKERQEWVQEREALSDRYTGQLIHAKKTAREAEHKMQEATRTHGQLVKDLDRLTKQLDIPQGSTPSETLKNMGKTIREIRRKNQHQEQEIEGLKEESESATEALTEAQDQLYDTEQRFNQLSETHSELVEYLQQAMNTLNLGEAATPLAMLKHITQDLVEGRQVNQEQAEELEGLRQDHQVAEKELGDTKARLHDTEQELDQVQTAHSELVEEVQQAMQKVPHGHGSAATASPAEAIQQLVEHVTALEEANQEQAEELEGLRQDHQVAEKELGDTKARLHDTEQELDQVQTAHSELVEEVQQAMQKVPHGHGSAAATTTTTTSPAEAIQQLVEHVTALEEANQERETAIETLKAEKEAEIRQLQMEQSQIRDEMEKNRNSNHQSKAEFDQLRSALMESKRKLTELQTKHTELQNTNNRLYQDIQQQNEAISEHNRQRGDAGRAGSVEGGLKSGMGGASIWHTAGSRGFVVRPGAHPHNVYDQIFDHTSALRTWNREFRDEISQMFHLIHSDIGSTMGRIIGCLHRLEDYEKQQHPGLSSSSYPHRYGASPPSSAVAAAATAAAAASSSSSSSFHRHPRPPAGAAAASGLSDKVRHHYDEEQKQFEHLQRSLYPTTDASVELRISPPTYSSHPSHTSAGWLRNMLRVRPVATVEGHRSPSGAKPSPYYQNVDPPHRSGVNRTTEVVYFPQHTDNQLILSGDLGHDKLYEFDHVFRPTCSADDVFENVRPDINAVVDGENVCIAAYGQSGSGKTYTIDHITIKAIKRIFRLIEQERGSERQFEVGFSCLELYCDQIFDLLDKNSNPNVKHEIRQDTNLGHIYITDMKVAAVGSVDEFQHLFQRAKRQLQVNASSGLSHVITRIFVHSEDVSTGELFFGKLTLVDLAGAEGASASSTAADGGVGFGIGGGQAGSVDVSWTSELDGSSAAERPMAIQFINRSLLSLGSVLVAVDKDSGHIPYRENKLTHILQDSLTMNNRVVMIGHISPLLVDKLHTLNTIDFSQRLSHIPSYLRILGSQHQQLSQSHPRRSGARSSPRPLSPIASLGHMDASLYTPPRAISPTSHAHAHAQSGGRSRSFYGGNRPPSPIRATYSPSEGRRVASMGGPVGGGGSRRSQHHRSATHLGTPTTTGTNRFPPSPRIPSFQGKGHWRANHTHSPSSSNYTPVVAAFSPSPLRKNASASQGTHW